MSETYFSKFPRISYSNTECVDISRRVGMSDTTKRSLTLFYPYELTPGMRPDLLAHSYYDDSYYDWLIFLTNGIIDPYYGWYLGEQEFENFIHKKYGSVEESLAKIKYYQMNWYDNDIEISPTRYNDNTPEILKKYYTPIFGVGTNIIGYQRRREDWYVNTNKILQFTVTMNSNTAFTADERLQIKIANTVVGNATCITSNTTAVFVQHIAGNTSANQILFGVTSGANATITDTDVMEENITNDEFIYWTPVTYYDWEREKNESNKFIRLLDGGNALPTAEDLRRKMKE